MKKLIYHAIFFFLFFSFIYCAPTPNDVVEKLKSCLENENALLCSKLFSKNLMLSVNGVKATPQLYKEAYWSLLFSKITFKVVSILNYIDNGIDCFVQFYVHMESAEFGSHRSTYSDYIVLSEGLIVNIDRVIDSKSLKWMESSVNSKKDRVLTYLKLIRSIVTGDYQTYIVKKKKTKKNLQNQYFVSKKSLFHKSHKTPKTKCKLLTFFFRMDFIQSLFPSDMVSLKAPLSTTFLFGKKFLNLLNGIN